MSAECVRLDAEQCLGTFLFKTSIAFYFRLSSAGANDSKLMNRMHSVDAYYRTR